VLLATGGIGGLYAVTTNPASLRGEGLGLAALAGARIADPEFVQFHPTAVDIGRDPAPLATEALRGEGAILIDKTGAPLMQGVHPQGDLAPRDVVARAIHAAILAGRRPMLDCRAAVGEEFPERFPVVFAACMAAGIDPRRQPIPVAPAAHYHMGGIRTDRDGASSLDGLWAAGECASTGVHGANRLASNSLLEAAVFGARAGRAAAQAQGPASALLSEPPPPQITPQALETLRPAMSRCAGVVRSEEPLAGLIGTIDGLMASGPAPALVAARLVAVAAQARRESRGGHYREDYPQTDAQARSSEVTVLANPGGGVEMDIRWT
jgi:L-aspartate oxidase